MSFRLALEAPDLVRGVAAIAASMPAQDNLDCRPAGKAVAVMIVNGTLDSINPYDGGEVTLLGPWGTRGVVKSSGASAGYWVGQAGYSTEPFIIRYPDVVPEDRSIAMHSVWSDQLRPEIGLITVHGGGHTIPHPTAEFPRFLGPVNRDFNAIDEIWQFFQREIGRAPGPPVALD